MRLENGGRRSGGRRWMCYGYEVEVRIEEPEVEVATGVVKEAEN